MTQIQYQYNKGPQNPQWWEDANTKDSEVLDAMMAQMPGFIRKTVVSDGPLIRKVSIFFDTDAHADAFQKWYNSGDYQKITGFRAYYNYTHGIWESLDYMVYVNGWTTGDPTPAFEKPARPTDTTKTWDWDWGRLAWVDINNIPPRTARPAPTNTLPIPPALAEAQAKAKAAAEAKALADATALAATIEAERQAEQARIAAATKPFNFISKMFRF